MDVDAFVVFICFGLIALIVGTGIWGFMRNAKMMALYREIWRANPLFCDYLIRFRIVDVTEGLIGKEQSSLVSVTEKGISIYPRTRRMTEKVVIDPSEIRWFGRPQKYSAGQNEIWLHIEKDYRWQTVKLHMWKDTMQAFVRAMKAIATEEQVKAYRRHRPYIHVGPVATYPAKQDLHGAWTLGEPIKLFLTPVMLVVLQEGQVLQTFALAEMDSITALKRLDAPEEPGLLRFRQLGADFAFALPAYEHFAELVANAARQSLEDPQILKGKKPDEDEIYEALTEPSDMVYEVGDFVVGDDGELVFIEKSST